MRKQDTYNEIREIKAETSIDNNSGLFVNTTNIDKYTRKEEKVLSRAQALHKRAGLVDSKVWQRVSVGTQHTNTFMRSTVQLVLWLLAFIMSLTMVYCLNTNRVNAPNNYMAVGDTTGDIDTLSIQGSGTKSSPYLINNESDLITLSQTPSMWGSTEINVYVVFGDDIIITQADTEGNTQWTPIGSEATPFYGIVNGQGHSITFQNPTTITADYAGVFGYVEGNVVGLGVIWSQGVQFFSAVGTQLKYVGSVVGKCYLVRNCYSKGSQIAFKNFFDYSGGVVGEASVVVNSYNECTINIYNSSYAVGGVTGYVKALTLNCYNLGKIYAEGQLSIHNLGGVIGVSSGQVIKCINFGNIELQSQVWVNALGGICGSYNDYFVQCINCLNLQKEIKYTRTPGCNPQPICSGGVMYVYNSYYDSSLTINGSTISEPEDKSIPVNNLRELMKNIDNYTNAIVDSDSNRYEWNLDYAWDMDGVWTFNNSTTGYPLLRYWNLSNEEKSRIKSTTLTNNSQSTTIQLNSEQDLRDLDWTLEVGFDVGHNKYELTNDITIESQDLICIGTEFVAIWDGERINTDDYPINAFNAEFDGLGHSIIYTQEITTNSPIVGFFETVQDCNISNLEVIYENGINVDVINSFSYVRFGGIVADAGYSDGGIQVSGNVNINNCSAKGDVNIISLGSRAMIGSMLAAYDGHVYISNCSNYMNFTVGKSMSLVGMIVGLSYNTNLQVNNCINYGNLSGTDIFTGAGIALGGTITNCLNLGTLFVGDKLAAICGTRPISSGSGSVVSSYYDADIVFTGEVTEDNSTKVTNLRQILQDRNVFKNGFSDSEGGAYSWDETAPWDFETVWGANSKVNNGLPVLRQFYDSQITLTYVDDLNSGNTREITYDYLDGDITLASADLFEKEGQTFAYWTDGVNKYSSEDIVNIIDNSTIYAVWYVPVTYNVTTNVSVILNVYDKDNNTVQSVYVDKRYGIQSVIINLVEGEEYIIGVSGLYTTTITQANGAQLNNGKITYTVVEGGIVGITVVGFSGGNGIIV